MKENKHSSCESSTCKSGYSVGHKRIRHYLLSLSAAILACLCCSIPLLGIAVGLAGASSIYQYFGNNHPAFQVLAIAILLGTSLFMWVQKKKGKMSGKGFLLQVVILLSMYGLMTAFMQGIFSPWLSERGYGITKLHGEH